MFDILHTHPDFLIINKHPNVSVHKDDGDTMLLQEVAKQSGDEQLYLIHRLDKMTSGILLLGRNAKAASALSQAFADRQVEKFYLAIGSKKPKKNKVWSLVIWSVRAVHHGSWSTAKTTQPSPSFSLLRQSPESAYFYVSHTLVKRIKFAWH